MEVTNCNGFINNPICVISDVEMCESGGKRNRKSSASISHARHYGKRSPNSVQMLTTNLKLFGLYFDDKTSPESDRRFNAIPKYLSNLQKIYCYVVTFILWLNVLRMTTVFVRPKAFGSTVVWRIMNFLWVVSSATLHTIYVRACSNGKLHSVMRDLCDTMENSKRLRTISITYSLIAWLFLIFNMTVMVYMQFLSQSDASLIVLSPFGSLLNLPEPTLTLVRALYLILHVYLSACAFYVPAMNCLIAYALSLQFRAFNREAITALDDGTPNQDGDIELSERLQIQNGTGRIETFRLKHQRLCAILKESDWFISRVFAVSISFEFSVFIFLPLNLLYYMTPDDVGIDYVKNFIWLAVAVICFTVTIYEAVTISTEAREIYDRLFEVNCEGPEATGQLNVFLSRLTSEQIGFTFLGIFVVNKKTILIMLGTLVAFFILVLPFVTTHSNAVSCLPIASPTHYDHPLTSKFNSSE